MQTYLIAGGNEKDRLKETEKLTGKKIPSLTGNPDFILLQAEEGGSIGVDEARLLQKKLSLKPFQEKQKIALIIEAQDLTTEAQNALLKTLEEPNATSLIILTAPDSFWLLPTIVSRCRVVQLPTKIGIELKENEFQEISETFNLILNSSIGRRLKIIEERGIAKEREIAILWLDKLSFVVREILLNCFGVGNQTLKTAHKVSDLLKILSLIRKYKKFLKANCNVRLTVDNFLLDLPAKSN